ncbi:hypothetical protein [Paraburkholderia atlantica]|uniref:hypothetical protein n=1 Tax=Paraburkholderia atlantica TaxID=2654982 RepID=UPI00161C39B8|nr:hypothetical protein [Paraburkholderia atlantica]MBB5509590.1 hypothetical protein [Paraburkholderia atlantica]
MQREMAVHGVPRKLQDAPIELLKMCEDELDAIRLCIQLSRFTHEFIGKELAIDKGHFSRIMSGSAGFPTSKRLALMRLCGNRAPIQYEAMHAGCELIESKEARIQELEALLQEAKQARAA